MKMKKLLASALAAAMVVSSMVGTIVTSAATSVGTITAGTVEKTVGDTDAVVAGVTIEFTEGVVAPHNIVSVALDGYTLDSVSDLAVVYADGSAEGVVEIDADGSNLAAGKILLEAPVDSKAPTVTKITFNANFVDADDVDTVAGTYDIVVSGDDMTDVNEADIAIDAVNGKLVVEEAVTEVHEAVAEWSYDDNNHWHACSVVDCAEGHTYDVAAHNWVGEETVAPGVTTTGTMTYTCDCDASKTEEIPATGEYVNYTGVAYDLVNNKITLTYGAPGTEFKALLSAGGKASEGRVVKLVVDVDGAEFLFDFGVMSGGGTMTASGFALSHMSANVRLFIRITNESTGYLAETNAYEIVIADYLTEQYESGADTSAKLAAWIDLYEVYKVGNEDIAITNATIEDGAVNYTGATYSTDSSKITLTYGAPGTDFKALLSAGGKASEGRVVKLVVDIDGTEFLFDFGVMSGGGTMTASGFSLSHYSANVKMFIRISNDSTGYLAETNAVNVNLGDVMAAAEGSAFATAYAAYAAAE